MKILEVSFRNPYLNGQGGLESYVLGLSKYLINRGEKVTIIYCEVKGNENKVKNGDNTVIRIPKLISRWKLDKFYYNFLLFFYVYKVKGIYDIIHINGDNGIYIPYLHGVKTIITLHGSMKEFSDVQVKTGGYKLLINRILDKYLGDAEKVASKKCDAVIAVSSHIKEYFEKLTGRKDIAVIHTCICPHKDAELNQKLKTQLIEYHRNGDLLCLWVGRDPTRKGLDIAKRVTEKLDNIILFTVGYEDKEATKNIVNLGIVSNIDLETLYNSCDILLFPTKFEGFSIALLEAMSRGVVPITFSIPSTRELITNGLNGYLCNSEEELIERLKNINDNRNTLIAMKKNAIILSRNYYCSKLYSKVYDLMQKTISIQK